MAAISNTLLTLLKPGDRVVSVKDTYGGTNKIFTEFLPHWNVNVHLCDTTDHDAIEAEIRKGRPSSIWRRRRIRRSRSLDFSGWPRPVMRLGAIVVADNTFATPINRNPLALGVDLVLHSATKFLGGHADALGRDRLRIEGADRAAFIIFARSTARRLTRCRAYLLLRGMKTLHLRIRQQNESAHEDRAFSSVQHPSVEQRVLSRPGSDPGHDDRRRQMRGFGGMLSFALRRRIRRVKAFLPKLQLAQSPGESRLGRRRSSVRRRRPAMSNALRRSGRRWAFPRR